MTQKHINFADVFPSATEAGWRKSVESVLKDKPFQSLISASADQIAIQPLYSAAAGPRALRRKSGDWSVLARIDHTDIDAANAQILADLEGGATGIHLVFENSVAAHALGISWRDPAILRTLLAKVQFQTGVRISLDLSNESRGAALKLAQNIADEGVAPNLVNVDFGLDPMSLIALNGGGENWSETSPQFAARAARIASFKFGGSVISADGSVVQAAGGTEAQELAFVLGCGVAYLRALETSVGLEHARDMMSYRMAADADVFLGIAKFRALRLLWARIEAACGLEPKPIDILATSGWAMMSTRDPWVNVLRAGSAAFAAGIGGADAISLLPFTQANGLPDAAARRLARNTQNILLHESHLGQVADPAAGAGGFESLTEELCKKAWSLFQDIESAGGIYAALKSGMFQAQVASAREAKRAILKAGKAKLIGVTHFKTAEELPMAVGMALPATSKRVGADFVPLLPIRFAEEFEP